MRKRNECIEYALNDSLYCSVRSSYLGIVSSGYMGIIPEIVTPMVFSA